jgi:Leucine-rich repeat (LRR) protein
MKTILQRAVLIFSLVLGLNTSVKAQLVYIPDSAFRAYLNQNFSSCMVGDSIDSTCTSALNAQFIYVGNLGIKDLTGLQVFVNVKTFYCNQNLLTSLPALPASMIELNIEDNNLTSLPALPNSLTVLYCQNNQLTILPALPTSLSKLNCSFNQLTNLPSLPNTITDLSCSGNQLTSLPTLPSSMITLRCNENQLTNLPPLPPSLTQLSCGVNQIANLPALPNSLIYITCGINQLTTLPTLPSSLLIFDCSVNQITNILALPSSLNALACSNNQLTSLPSLPASLNTLYCQYNPLKCLPYIDTLTNLDFSNTLVNCLPNYGNVIISNPLLSSIPLCDIFNSNGCEVFWNIEGTTFVDLDSNCILGNNEKGYANQKLNLYRNGVLVQQTYTNINGNYDFDTFSNGFYKTELDTNGLPFEVNCPNTGFYLDTISATDSIKYDRDFAIKCNGIDLAATSIITSPPVPARFRTVKVSAGDLSKLYGTNCATGVCGTVSITITGACSYISSPSYALTPNAVSGNVLTYYITDFGAISYDSTFDFNLLVDTTAALGSQICITVNVTTASTELNYNNNQFTQCFTVVGSFDPNDKNAYPGTTLDISGNKWLNYTIRFQNTGTAEAEHIYITDTMSNLVDISTFKLLSYSNQPLMLIYNDGLVKFNFPNIHLPDSNTNEPASHGYVQYKIRAKDSLTVGSTIDNTANIFFDFNAPVITNTTSNLLINCSIPKTILNATICGGEAYVLNGQEYYNTGVYQQNILTAFGCDSVVELRLTVNTINNSITQSFGTLQTTATATNYQWINCTTGTAIVGANTQTFNPTQSGSYSVVIDFGGCVDTSNCYYFSPIGINEINANNINIQPNPFNTELKITLDKNYNGVLEVYNTIGALIYSEKLQGRNVTLNTSNWNAGVYILKVATNDGVVVKKVVKR